MLYKVNSFLVAEEGAVTVDWVVLTAAMLAFGTTVFIALNPSSLVEPIATELGNGVPSTGF